MHIACMPRTITIRHVPDATGDALAAKAAASGRSLQEYLRGHLIELASRPDMETLMTRARDRKERMGSRLSADTIVAHREAERR